MEYNLNSMNLNLTRWNFQRKKRQKMSRVLIFLKIDVKGSFKKDNVQQKDHSLKTWVFLF
jgi:hypothetical protein